MKREVLGVWEQLQFEKSLLEVVGAAAVHDEYGVGYYMLCGFGDNGNAC